MSQRTLLDRTAILAAPDLKTEEVFIPQWGGTVIVRALTANQRDEFESDLFRIRMSRAGEMQADISYKGLRAKVVSWSVVDENGERVFRNSDRDALGEKNAGALDIIFDKAQQLSGLDDDDVAEMEKNSGSDQSGDSSSD
ncbi:MAG: hypothetical protein MOGMAGMI_01868 [Candidatus Omnitrophica bacterium]|nr:hypothetical protein [Candidatus Omnitrophota bacterium]